jgi:hypothetical protein
MRALGLRLVVALAALAVVEARAERKHNSSSQRGGLRSLDRLLFYVALTFLSRSYLYFHQTVPSPELPKPLITPVKRRSFERGALCLRLC